MLDAHGSAIRVGIPAMTRALWVGFVASADRFPNRPALSVSGRTLTYAELRGAACAVAATLQVHRDATATPLTAVFAYRSATAFVAVLGALLAGHGYVPLNPMFPVERTKVMLSRSGSRTLVVDSESSVHLETLLADAERTLVILPDSTDVADWRTRLPQHDWLGASDLEAATTWQRPPENPDAIAYMLFTSGSTGVPKAVIVAHRNVVAFVDHISRLYEISEHDRFSQMFDMTFDLSVFDMFVCWERGALLCCPTQKTLIKPGRFIRDNQLTIWFSVPSTAIFMKQLGMLKPGRYPSLRLSLFCGEPLPVTSITAWGDAAPNSVLENLYGPTELTIACTRYRWNPDISPAASELGIVPIGYPFPEMSVLVVDEELKEVAPGEIGELLMTGPQTSLGYWRDEGKTAAAFIIPPGQGRIFYRTGDRVRSTTSDKPMTHLGRMDFQVKVFGYRVELGEIEAVIREASGSDGVVALGWPRTDSGFGGIEAFVEGQGDATSLRDQVGQRLPDYMTPRRIHFLDRLPRTTNDKFDRKTLTDLLKEGL